MQLFWQKNWLLDCYAFILGSLLVLAFAPFSLSLLAFILPAGLLAIWLRSSPKRAFWRGFLFGLGLFGFGATWVYISIHSFGGVNALLAGLLTAIPLTILCLFPAVQGYLFNKLWKLNTLYKSCLIFPALWVVFEWLREWVLTGFPWLYLGTSQVNGLLGGFAPLSGTFGTSFVTALVASLILLLITRPGFIRYLSFFSIILLFALSTFLFHYNWTTPSSQPISVALVQGNVPQSMKWDPALVTSNIQRYERLTKPYWQQQLIVWPENAVPLPTSDAQELLDSLNQFSKKQHSTLLTGIPIDINDDYYNGLIAVGTSHGEYRKRHLVPFGEYVPFGRSLSSLIQFFNLPMSDFVAGPTKQPLILLNNKTPIAPFICYEIAYSALINKDLPTAELLIVVSDDAWFGHSVAAWQHLQIAQMQALTTGREILFSSNNGITAIINANGRIIAAAPRFTQTVLIGSVQPLIGSTPWVWLGNTPIIVLMFVLLIFGFLLFKPTCLSGKPL